MNYDNLHTTAEILEAFQGCRDAGEEIDLFEVLAWRDEPPIDAFIEIVRKIKLEPVLALATQALGWVKNAEVLERLKKSDELLEILSNLAKSGATDLIKWSAAKSIIAIGFDFISVSQHLTEMPADILKKCFVTWCRSGNLCSCIYIDPFEVRRGCLNKDHLNDYGYRSGIHSYYLRRGIRAIKEQNLYFLKVYNSSCQRNEEQIYENEGFVLGAQERCKQLLESQDKLGFDILKILLTNQILCAGSNHLKARKASVEFLCSFTLTEKIEFIPEDINEAVKKVVSITDDIKGIVKENVGINVERINNQNGKSRGKEIIWSKGWLYIDEHLFLEISDVIETECEEEIDTIQPKIMAAEFDNSRYGISASVGFIVFLIFGIATQNLIIGLFFAVILFSILFFVIHTSRQEKIKELFSEVKKSKNRKDYRDSEMEKVKCLLNERQRLYSFLQN